MQKALLLSTLMVAVALAGCSDGGSSGSDVEEDPFQDVDTSATSTTGVIRGVVVDESIAPVAGATIEILNTEFTATSLETGAFAFSGLDPGAYFLKISKVGFETVQTNVDVVAGVDKPDIRKVILARAPGTEPLAQHLNFRGYIGCSIQVANLVDDNTCGWAVEIDPDTHQIFDFGTTDAPDYVQTELVWTHTQEFGRRLGVIQCMEDAGSCGIGGEARMGNYWGESPLICRNNQTHGCGNDDGTGGGQGLNTTGFTGKIDVGVFANCYSSCLDFRPLGSPGGIGATALGVGVVLQQDYDLYATIFYNFDPDPEWTFFEDGQYEVPEL